MPVALGATVELGAPRTLFDLPQGAPLLDMTPDAERFLVGVPTGGEAGANALTVVLNWQGSTASKQ